MAAEQTPEQSEVVANRAGVVLGLVNKLKENAAASFREASYLEADCKPENAGTACCLGR